MPSIQDVADQINAKLDAINSNTANNVTISTQIKNDVDVSNNILSGIHTTLSVDLANLSQGVFQVTEYQKVEIAFLNYMRQQNDTIICLLQNNNEMLCGITRKFTTLLDLTAKTLSYVAKIEGIEERVHAAEAADVDRLATLKEQMEECCPPEKPPVEPCPPACPVAPFRIPDTKGTGWVPISGGRDDTGGIKGPA